MDYAKSSINQQVLFKTNHNIKSNVPSSAVAAVVCETRLCIQSHTLFQVGFHSWLAPTGCLRVRGLFDTPLISVVDGPILKSFEVVRANTGRFDLVYKNASQVGNYPSKYGVTFGQIIQQMKFLGSQPSTFIEITKISKLQSLVM